MTKEFVEYVTKILVDNPDDVSVTETENEQSIMIAVNVAKEDLGKIIGKQGRTASALRLVVGAMSTKMTKRVLVDIVD